MHLAHLAAFAAVATGAMSGLGCATLPPCPARGGPAWSETSTEHFDLQTDMNATAATAVVTMLEDTRAAMLATVWNDQPGPPERMRVVAFQSHRQLEVLTGNVGTAAFTLYNAPLDLTIVVSGDTPEDLDALRASLAHALVAWFMPVLPVWYAQGIISFLGTIRYDRVQGNAIVGEVATPLLAAVQRWGLMPVQRLLLQPPPTDSRGRIAYSATSWLLVHYLLNHHPKAFKRYQARLLAREHVLAAWDEEFPDLPPATLNEELARYARSTSYVVASQAMAPWQGRPTARTLSDGEVHGLRAFLHSFVPSGGQPHPDGANADLDEAEGTPVPSLEALAIDFYFRRANDRTARSTLAQRAAAAHAESWLAWIMVADSTDVAAPAHDAALDRALELAPDSREVMVRVARSRAQQQRWDESLVFSSRALRAGVFDQDLWTAHMTALVKTGNCAEAQQWANTMAGNDPWPPARRIAELWGKLHASCVEQPHARPLPLVPVSRR